MSQVRARDTSPELQVRRLAHRLGYRYRLYVADLPGKPDLVFPARKRVVFVHGCFWHGHNCRAGRKTPKSNLEYWNAKLNGNRRRHRRTVYQLRALGWKSLTIWECQVRDPERVQERLVSFLGD